MIKKENIFSINKAIRKSRNLLLLLLTFTVVACNPESGKNTPRDQNWDKAQPVEAAILDTTPRVTGIGGIFFKSENPGRTMQWYGENLGLALTDYGSTFEFRNANHPEQINYLQWGIFSKNTDYFKPSKKELMINYRVQHLEALVEKLRKNGVTIVDSIESYDYGKFVHIMDPDGNKLELWEPVDHVLTKIGGKTTK
jgi:predicted enzyme related to lactoylglutathione lyase